MKRLFITICLSIVVLSIYSQNDKERFDAYIKTALQGNANAQNIIGWCYKNGRGIEKNAFEAFEWFMKAATQGYADAQYNVGQCYLRGGGIEKNEYKAFEWFLKAAQQGHADAQKYAGYCFEWTMKAAQQGNAIAQINVGRCYMNGNVVERNEYKAFEWLLKAARQNIADAQNDVGLCYKNGLGTEKNEYKAFECFLKAAQQGYALAQGNVGECYFFGQGTERNEYRAFEWYMKAAQQGNADAQTTIGWCYMMGQGTEKNEFKAFEWYVKAAQQSNVIGQRYVGYCYCNGIGTEKDELMAFEWSMKAAQLGDAIAQCYVGWSYENGIGTEKNEYKAFEWYMKAAQQGDSGAQLSVGWYYRDGRGVAENANESYKWIKKSADAGYSPAFNDLAYCYMQGNGTEVNEKVAWDWLNKALAAEPQNPNYIDSKGEFYSMENDAQKALETWDEINKLSPTYYADKDTPFSKYVKSIKGDDIDLDIPTFASINKNTFAIIIANENYQDVTNVPYALNDGSIFAEYCEKTLGIPSRNISFIKDATLNNIRREINWLKQVLSAYNGEASVIVYYAGHGIPDETGKTSYLLPIDGIGNDVSTGYSLSDLYTTLSSQPAKHITVFLDACFSGTNRDGSMLTSARGVAIKAKQTTPTGNLVVFSAAQGDETAWPYKEQQHGLFTYYLLKKIKESKGDVSLEYVSTEVKRQSIVINRKSQTPTMNASVSLGNNWKSWKLK